MLEFSQIFLPPGCPKNRLTIAGFAIESLKEQWNLLNTGEMCHRFASNANCAKNFTTHALFTKAPLLFRKKFVFQIPLGKKGKKNLYCVVAEYLVENEIFFSHRFTVTKWALPKKSQNPSNNDVQKWLTSSACGHLIGNIFLSNFFGHNRQNYSVQKK